jgi:TonB family protein
MAPGVMAGVISALFITAATAETDLLRHLNEQYKGKTFILRGFYAGGHLTYDPAGQAINPAFADDWTVAGVVQVEELRVSGHYLSIEARRLHLGWPDGVFQELHDYDANGKPDKDEGKNRSLIIEADLGLVTVDAADRVLSQMFLSSRDNFADLVPDYWRACIQAASIGKGSKSYSDCHFSQEFFVIPGVVPSSGQSTEPARTIDGEAQPGRGPVFRAGFRITLPKPLNHPQAGFSEEARRAKYGGTSLLSLVVDKMGAVRDVRILKPLGMKLDQEAVDTALKYTFNPATKDGQPVAVQIALEVDFPESKAQPPLDSSGQKPQN